METKITPTAKTAEEIITTVASAIIDIESEMDKAGLTGVARKYVRMMGANRNPEYLRANGAKQQPDGTWMFFDGSTLR
jgi:hypothetical protein